jgi:hypothetical protein
VDLVYHLLYVRQVNNNAFLDRRLPHYEGIRTLAEQNSPLWVFSLNHDVMVEAIAARFSIPLHCGFSPTVVTLPRRGAFGKKQGDLRAEVLTKHDLENSAMYFPNPGQKGIYLLKIHGALDVFTFNNGEDLLKLVPNDVGQHAAIDTLRAANEELIYVIPGAPGGKAKTTNEIAYADDQGEMQFLRRSLLAGAYKFGAGQSQVLPKSLLKHFRANLNFVSTLVCIGYGFGDFHINSILSEWLEFSAGRHLEIVNPTAERVPPFFLHLAPQITITRSTTTDYLDTKAGISWSPRERLEKRLFAYARPLGRERFASAMSEFIRQDNDRMTRAMHRKIAQLPICNGDVDLTSVGDPQEVAKKWAADIQGSEEERLERILNFFEAKNTG